MESHKQPLSLERLFTIVATALKMTFFLRVGRRASLHVLTGLRGSTDGIFVHRHAWIVDSFVLTFLGTEFVAHAGERSDGC